jgi:hypothetical protein
MPVSRCETGIGALNALSLRPGRARTERSGSGAIWKNLRAIGVDGSMAPKTMPNAAVERDVCEPCDALLARGSIEFDGDSPH